MSSLEIHMFPCFSDNYGLLVHDRDTGMTAAIDTPDADAILAALAQRSWSLTHIWNTHHHADHAGGNLRLKRETGCRIVGLAPMPRASRASTSVSARVTSSCSALFALGRGRLFEGNPRRKRGRRSRRFGAGRTRCSLYCRHEYTQADARFAVTVVPDNAALAARVIEIDRLRRLDEPTIPTSVGAREGEGSRRRRIHSCGR